MSGGRHEEHWQRAASEITQELERIKAAHVPATAEEIEAPVAPRRGRPRRTEVAKTGDEEKKPRTRRTSKTTSAAGAAGGTEPTTPGESQQNAPRRLGRKPGGEAQPEAAPSAGATARRRMAKGTTGAQSEPAADAAPVPKTRRKKSEGAETNPEATAAERPTRRGCKPKADSPH